MFVWGGHVGTSNKSIAFNGNAPIPILPLDTSNGLPAGADGRNYIWNR